MKAIPDPEPVFLEKVRALKLSNLLAEEIERILEKSKNNRPLDFLEADLMEYTIELVYPDLVSEE
ncbi:hypothetical protein Pse7367_3677 (plasmid) [Thalassoporum mexicanum PCC 7367]|uniref:hypothetical protein n=1 Tax=Thalassoporum mexicanum TaxID=3457544 RepID=UPI00029FAC49|nr:hypothetical protein [Pseudanabaena sp. PCC 7367]AFY71910.1 hypothetical protein Pse7367_3677 [Pseudanabaena sp. PCC 7367]